MAGAGGVQLYENLPIHSLEGATLAFATPPSSTKVLNITASFSSSLPLHLTALIEHISILRIPRITTPEYYDDRDAPLPA